MNYNNRIATELKIEPRQAQAAIQLLDDGNTIPFIARYRKEMTFNLDELQLRQIETKVQQLRAIDDRREQIIKQIDKHGKLSDSLSRKLKNAQSLLELEDLYQPYKETRRTRASKAIAAGLEALAQKILNQPHDNIAETSQQYLCEAYPTIDDVLSGARDIVAQIIANSPDTRGNIRRKVLSYGKILSVKIKSAIDNQDVFKVYYDFQVNIKWIKPYQILAINRGESTKILRVKIQIEERYWSPILYSKFKPIASNPWGKQLDIAMQDSIKRLILPAVERDVRRHLTELAHEHAIEVFTNNLQGLLLQPPITGYIVMGIDPGFRSGCKVAVVDEIGKLLDTVIIYPNAPQNQHDKSIDTLNRLVKKYHVGLIAIGNGTAVRETETLVAQLIQQSEDLQYLIVSEAGASVYSASDIAREEFPDIDVSLRGAVSIARRVQDPLAELVKIDPRSIGVGLYQHDLNQGKLLDSLSWVVQSVVNQVGADLNTSSIALLTYVSGLSDSIAQEIVRFRETNGKFASREQLLDVKGLGSKTFEQSAGFLRIYDGSSWLDSSAIHPESYRIARRILRELGIDENTSLSDREQKIQRFLANSDLESLVHKLSVGSLTVEDILDQIIQPGRDPREDIPLPILRKDILRMEDLEVGVVLQGTVRNVVDFGAFVDIGVKQDGLLHSSKIPRGLSLQVGDVIEVQILSIDIERGRIGLSIGI